MTIHLLNEEDRNFCGRSRTVGGSVTIDQVAKVTCRECLQKASAKTLGSDKSIHARGHASSPSTHVSSPTVPYDPTLDLLNPLNPLSPLSPIHYSEPSMDHHSPSHDHPPSHDPSPSHDSGGYDSGGSFDSGGGSDGGGGGGMD